MIRIKFSALAANEKSTGRVRVRAHLLSQRITRASYADRYAAFSVGTPLLSVQSCR